MSGSRNSNVPSDEEPPSPPVVLDEMVAKSIASLKVALTAAAGSTFDALPAGNIDVTVGGVVSAGSAVSKTTSTQSYSDWKVLVGNALAP